MAGETEKKVTVQTIYRDDKRLVRLISVPPGASTGKHKEKRDYLVIPLVNGTIKLEISRTVRGKRETTSETIKLKKYQPYLREVGDGLEIDLCNVGGRPIHIFKD
jgi:hypothetical protein